MDNRIIFLGGSPRSGTTLVQNMLDSHPDILGGPEFLHLPDVLALRQKLQVSVNKGWINLICSSDMVDAQIRAFIDNIFLSFADAHSAKYVSEKTPENVLVFEGLLDLYPSAKFIHIVRDPRAIVASLLAVGNKARSNDQIPATHTENVISAIEYVKKCLKAGFRAAEKCPEQVHTVLYEKLVCDPESESEKLCKFLELDVDEAMLKPGEKSHLGEAAITVNSGQIWFDKNSYNSNPNTASLEKWKNQLSAHEQLIVRQQFSGMKELVALGYCFDEDDRGSEFSAGAKITAAIVVLRAKISSKFSRQVRKRVNV